MPARTRSIRRSPSVLRATRSLSGTDPTGPTIGCRLPFAPAGGEFAAADTISASGADADDNKLAVDGQGNAAAVWTRPSDTAIEVAGYDAAGPMLRNLLLPTTNRPGTGFSFSVNPVDVWSGVASTNWSFR